MVVIIQFLLLSSAVGIVYFYGQLRDNFGQMLQFEKDQAFVGFMVCLFILLSSASVFFVR